MKLLRSMPATKEPQQADFVGDVAVSPDGRLVYAAILNRNEVSIINPQSGMLIEEFKTGRRPYRLLFHPDGKSFFVTSWADGTLYHHAAETGKGARTAAPRPPHHRHALAAEIRAGR